MSNVQYSMLKVHLDQWSLTRQPSLLAVAPTISSSVTRSNAQIVEPPMRSGHHLLLYLVTRESCNQSVIRHVDVAGMLMYETFEQVRGLQKT